MRKFKFRIWDENKKEFISEDEGVTIRANDGSVDAYPRYEDGFIIQQFTGLLDKNKKEIYEGDIIKNSVEGQGYCSPAVVSFSVYEEVGWAFFFKPKKISPRLDVLKKNINGIDLYEEFLLSHRLQQEYEIIGNIFETPELLK